jgi:hypothetical protein
MEDLVRGMHGLHEGAFDTIYILTMTDYDPAGYYIADALSTQVRDILVALNVEDVEVEIRRIGITPDQLSPAMVKANKYSPKPANLEKWFAMTGGIDGEPKGLELDALEPDQIREIFVTHLMDYIDPEEYKGFIKRAYIREVALQTMAPLVKTIFKKLIEEEEENIEVKEFSMVELAEQGYSYIPIATLCERDRDNVIKGKTLGYFSIESSDDNTCCAHYSSITEGDCEYFGGECAGIDCGMYTRERKNRCLNKGRGCWCAKLQDECIGESEFECNDYKEENDK